MFARPLLIAAVLTSAAPVAAQTLAPQIPPPAPPSPVAAPAPAQAFPSGAEVLSVDGEALGVLARVEIGPDGEGILHIRRPDGSMTAAPAAVASRGERAVVLDWTRAEFETSATPAAAASAPIPPPA